jgi:hypothetical protein
MSFYLFQRALTLLSVRNVDVMRHDAQLERQVKMNIEKEGEIDLLSSLSGISPTIVAG